MRTMQLFLLREPLLHFFLLGALLFAVFEWLNRGSPAPTDQIIVDQARITALATGFQRTWQRTPDAAELSALVDNWVREEILYREGIALGLDQDDPVVRTRMALKMNFLADVLLPETTAEQDLQNWLEQHPEDYTLPTRYSFRQVFFDPQHHGDDLDARIADARSQLNGDSQEPAGDATLLPAALENASSAQVSRIFGHAFATALANQPVAAWSNPVETGFGIHLIYLRDRQEGRLPELAEVSSAVSRDLAHTRSEQARDRFYQTLRERYIVHLPAAPIADRQE